MQKAAYFDITAIMELLKGEKNLLTVVETHKEFYTGALAVLEIVSADEFLFAKKLVKTQKHRELIGSFVVLPVTREDAEKAGEIVGKVKAAGKGIGMEEAVVAAQCFRKGLTLVTRNNSFNDIKKFVDLKLHKI